MSEIKSLQETEYRELTKSECLREIGRVIGFRGHKRTILHKADLNSIYWYIKGEQYCIPHALNTARSPSYLELRNAVADVVGFAYRDTRRESPRPFRVNELHAIVYAVRNSRDNRDHAETMRNA